MKRINGDLITQSLWKRTHVVITSASATSVTYTFVSIPQLFSDYKIEAQLIKCMNIEERYDKFW